MWPVSQSDWNGSSLLLAGAQCIVGISMGMIARDEQEGLTVCDISSAQTVAAAQNQLSSVPQLKVARMRNSFLGSFGPGTYNVAVVGVVKASKSRLPTVGLIEFNY